MNVYKKKLNVNYLRRHSLGMSTVQTCLDLENTKNFSLHFSNNLHDTRRILIVKINDLPVSICQIRKSNLTFTKISFIVKYK